MRMDRFIELGRSRIAVDSPPKRLYLACGIGPRQSQRSVPIALLLRCLRLAWGRELLPSCEANVIEKDNARNRRSAQDRVGVLPELTLLSSPLNHRAHYEDRNPVATTDVPADA